MNYLDTRDLQKSLNELTELRDAVTEAWDELLAANADPEREHEREDLSATHDAAEGEFGPDEKRELDELETIESEVSDFRHGETLIPVSGFTEYAQKLAEDTGDMRNANQWPFTCIDWEQAAKELAQGYTEVTYQGEDYYVRASPDNRRGFSVNN